MDRERRATPGILAEASAAGASSGYPTGIDSLYERIGPRFGRSEVRSRLRRYVAGLIGYGERKNCERLAEYAGEKTPDGMQRLLSTARWDADAVRDDLRDYVVARLADSHAVLSITEVGFRRRGGKSAGVKRQLNPSSGRMDNCQVGVFLAYASPMEKVFVDRELYLPEEWAVDAKRREDALVPGSIAYRTKPQLALQMLRRASAAGISVSWVTGRVGYGSDLELCAWLEGRRQPYVLGIASDYPLSSETEQNQTRGAAQLVVAARFSAGRGSSATASEGMALEWPLVPLSGPVEPGWKRWLLARRSLSSASDPIYYYLVFARAETEPAEIIRAATLHRAVRKSAPAAKMGAGLGDYEVRHWDGWYRHMTLSLLAHAFLVLGLAEAGDGGREDTTAPPRQVSETLVRGEG
jgi:SRSO17 transposase